METTEKKTRAPRKTVTRDDLVKELNSINTRIDSLLTKKSNIEKKIQKMDSEAIMKQILASGKSLDELLAFARGE